MFSFGDYIYNHDDTGMNKFLAGSRKCQNHKYSAVDIRLYLESKEWLKANSIGSQSVKVLCYTSENIYPRRRLQRDGSARTF